MFCCKLVMGKIHTNISDIIDSLTFINDGIEWVFNNNNLILRSYGSLSEEDVEQKIKQKVKEKFLLLSLTKEDNEKEENLFIRQWVNEYFSMADKKEIETTKKAELQKMHEAIEKAEKMLDSVFAADAVVPQYIQKIRKKEGQ